MLSLATSAVFSTEGTWKWCVEIATKIIRYFVVTSFKHKLQYERMFILDKVVWRMNVRTVYRSFERMEQFRYLGTTLTNQNSIQEEIRSRLQSGNACYHSVQNLLFSRLLSRNLKIKIYRTIILPVVCMGVKLGRWHWGRNAGWRCLRMGCSV